MNDGSASLAGSLRAFFLFDIAEEIDLPLLRRILGATPSKREPAFRHPAPEYVRFERPPVVEHTGVCATDSGTALEAKIRYFDYGVASVELRMPFTATWDGLVRLANNWILSPALEASAGRTLRARLAAVGECLKKPHTNWIAEDFYGIQVDPIPGGGGSVTPAD